MAGFKIAETDGLLRVIPARLPTFWIVASMLPVAILFTVITLFLERPSSSEMFSLLSNVFVWGWIAACWLMMPFVAAVLTFVNRQKAKTDDFLRVDMTRRAVELCRTGRTVQAAEILAFTEVLRYFRLDRRGGEWIRNLQTGVLARTASGGVELLALADGKSRPPLADRLASIFQVPVRRIELSRSESRALNDC
jgi:hypothetical protein